MGQTHSIYLTIQMVKFFKKIWEFRKKKKIDGLMLHTYTKIPAVCLSFYIQASCNKEYHVRNS